MPSHRASWPGAASSKDPSATRNAPSALARFWAVSSLWPPRTRSMSLVNMAERPLVGLEHDLDAAVRLVAERLVHLGPVLERGLVRDHEGGVDLALLDAAQQVVGPAVDVRLAGADLQGLVHQHAERELVDQAAVDARDREGP